MDQQEKQICPLHKKEMNQVVIRNEHLLVPCCEDCIVKTIDFNDYVKLLALRRDSFIKAINEGLNLLKDHLAFVKEQLKILNLPESLECLILNPYLVKVTQDIDYLNNNQLNTFIECNLVEDKIDQMKISELEIDQQLQELRRIYNVIIANTTLVNYKRKFVRRGKSLNSLNKKIAQFQMERMKQRSQSQYQ